MVDYKKLYSELRGPGEVSPEMVFGAKSAEQSGAFRSKHPEIFNADHPLAFSDAQNMAQKSKDKSDELQDAFKAASSGDFESMPSDTGMRGKKLQESVEESMDKFYTSIGLKKDPASGGWKNKQGQIEIGKPQWGVTVPGWSSSGSGAGITSSPQTSTSNVAPYGYTPREITPMEKADREYNETPWWRRPAHSPSENAAAQYGYDTFLKRQ